MAKDDQEGGPVDTIHNARGYEVIVDGHEEHIHVYATKKEEEIYENKPEYDSRSYHTDPRYKEKNRQDSKLQDQGILTDAYTGEKLMMNDKRDLDHVIPAQKIHEDAGRILAEIDGPELANKSENLASTDRSINRSKKDKLPDKFTEGLEKNADRRGQRIEELNRKEELADNEKKELHKLEKLDSVDQEKLLQRAKEAEKAIDSTINRKYYASVKFLKNTGFTSIKEGSKMGLRQMTYSFVRELIDAVFDEIRDYCSQAKKMEEKWYETIKERLTRIGQKIVDKWKSILESGKEGFISGFCSNILTVVINTFFTTAKHIVTLIREGFFSLTKAVKMLINPPEGISTAQLFHEVGKILVAGGIGSFGILMEETIDKFPPMVAIKSIPVVGELLTDVVLGLMIGLATALALWGYDKLDIFGYKKELQHKFVMDALNKDAENSEQRYKDWLETIRKSDVNRYNELIAMIGSTL
jgi:5-methylcytosine-specific restriction endonuclease McrA